MEVLVRLLKLMIGYLRGQLDIVRSLALLPQIGSTRAALDAGTG